MLLEFCYRTRLQLWLMGPRGRPRDIISKDHWLAKTGPQVFISIYVVYFYSQAVPSRLGGGDPT
jgi:hypothetical protein